MVWTLVYRISLSIVPHSPSPSSPPPYRRNSRPSYDVELSRAKKPTLKAVLQGDASASLPMILCVSRVYSREELGPFVGSAAAVVEVRGAYTLRHSSVSRALNRCLLPWTLSRALHVPHSSCPIVGLAWGSGYREPPGQLWMYP